MSGLERFLSDCEFVYTHAEPEIVLICRTFIEGIKLDTQKRVSDAYLCAARSLPSGRSYGHH